MLFIDTGVLGVVTIIVTSLIGLFGVAAGLEGYMFANLNVIERLLSIVGGLCLIIPGTVTDIVGIVLVGISAALQMMKKEESGCGIEEMDESYIGVYCKENLHMI